MKILFGIVGALAGAVFGLNLAITGAELLNRSDTALEVTLAFVFGSLSLLAGIIAGIIVALRAIACFRENSASETGRHRRWQILTAVFLGIPIVFVAITMIGREAAKPPSDSAMIRHFEEHSRTFDSLVQMTHADKGLARVDEDWSMPDDTQSVGVPSDRLSTYRKLLRDAGTPRGFQLSKDGTGIDFLFWLRGSAISDDETKGFAYRENPPKRIVQTLDGVRADGRDYFIAYRHIRDNWYLFYEFVPD